MKNFFYQVLNYIIKQLNQLKKNYLVYADLKNHFPLINPKTNQLGQTKASYLRNFQAQVKDITGMLTDQEAEVLFYLSATANTTGNIVEVGSWLGKSTIYLAKGCQVSENGRVYAVDTFKGNPGKESLYTAPLKPSQTIYGQFKKNLCLAGVNKLVKPFKMTSQKARDIIKKKSLR
ncbi:MAG: hypothetical protein GF390_00165, partial [Candidatus Pacebacteria bacterium]|nr:hypothetical protein [Candidatus Paceibacterota bacterium]